MSFVKCSICHFQLIKPSLDHNLKSLSPPSLWIDWIITGLEQWLHLKGFILTCDAGHEQCYHSGRTEGICRCSLCCKGNKGTGLSRNPQMLQITCFEPWASSCSTCSGGDISQGLGILTHIWTTRGCLCWSIYGVQGTLRQRKRSSVASKTSRMRQSGSLSWSDSPI